MISGSILDLYNKRSLCVYLGINIMMKAMMMKGLPPNE